jgi:hypothetical protein
MKAFNHLRTIMHHKRLVRKGCFKVGLYKQGMLHDLSKYSPTEFLVGCKYYQGNMSPNNAERLENGLSLAWLHHKGRNKHHLEYWIDYGADKEPVSGMKMPVRYVVEMFIDRVSASKTYQREKYTDQSPLQYYERGRAHYMIHPQSRALLEQLLHMLAEHGEAYTYDYIRKEILKNRK